MELKFLGVEEVESDIYRFRYSFEFMLGSKIEEFVDSLPLSLEDSYEEISQVIAAEFKDALRAFFIKEDYLDLVISDYDEEYSAYCGSKGNEYLSKDEWIAKYRPSYILPLVELAKTDDRLVLIPVLAPTNNKLTLLPQQFIDKIMDVKGNELDLFAPIYMCHTYRNWDAVYLKVKHALEAIENNSNKLVCVFYMVQESPIRVGVHYKGY